MTLFSIKHSLYHEIKTVILPDLGYIEDVSGEQLAVKNRNELTYSFSHQNIAYANPSGVINPAGVSLYDGSRKLALNEYSVNYLDSTVALSASPSGVLTADYKYYTVNVIDAFPESEWFEKADLPVMSVEVTGNNPRDFAIGQSASFWGTPYVIDIFASNDVMRMNIGDGLQKYLKKAWLPILKFDEMPLLPDGTINVNFNWTWQFIQWIKMKGQPSLKLINLGDISEKDRYRAVIEGVLTTIN